jgi:alpha/beta superfamily hydrolase
MMDSHLFRKAAWRLPALAGVAVLRFNTRGTESPQGKSEGGFDHGRGERFDVAAALDLVEFEDLPAPWLVGWSFGTELALLYGSDPSVVGAVLLAPALKLAGDGELEAWARGGKPLVVVVPELDDYLRPPAARDRFARVPQARVVEVAHARHLFVGHTEEALDEVVRAVAPEAYPLPRRYPP